MKEAEEMHILLQLECEKYKSVLAETVSRMPGCLCLVMLQAPFFCYKLSNSALFLGGDFTKATEECGRRRKQMEDKS